VTTAVSPRSFPQSSTGRLEVMIVAVCVIFTMKVDCPREIVARPELSLSEANPLQDPLARSFVELDREAGQIAIARPGASPRGGPG